MPIFTIRTPRGHEVDIDAPDEATAISGAQRWDHEDFATSEAKAAGLDPDLVLRQMQKESAGKVGAISPKGARGLMQLMPATAAELGVDPDDPYDNIRGGVRYLKKQFDDFGGDPELALAAYNAGPAAVRKHGGVPPYAETQDYVRTLAPAAGDGSVREAGTGLAVNEAQTRTFKEIGANPKATPGSRELPFAQRAEGELPGPGEWYIDLAGKLQQVPEPAISEGMGFIEGVTDVTDNIMKLQDAAPFEIGLFPGMRRMQEIGKDKVAEGLEQMRDQGYAPGKIGRFAGNMLASSPTMMLPGGAFVQGAAGGALLTDGEDAGDYVRGALFGGLAGKAGDMALRGAGKVLSGVTDPAVQTLLKAGVPLTPGQLAGGAVKRVEDAATSIPFIGDVVHGGQRRSLEGWNRATIDEVLAPVGEKLPKDVAAGYDAVDYAATALSNKYEALLPQLVIKADPTFKANVANLSQLVKGLPKEHASEFNQVLKDEVFSRMAPKTGVMSGEAMKEAESALSQAIRGIRKAPSSTRWDHKLGDAYAQLQAELREMVARGNPELAGELQAINKGWARLKRVEGAAASTGSAGGVFSPAAMTASVKRQATESSVARGKAQSQKLASAAKQVLPSSVPDSGTATRSMLGLLFGGGAAGMSMPQLAPLLFPAGAALGAYSRAGSKVMRPLFGSRPAVARKAGEQLPKLARPAAALATTGAARSRDTR